MYIDMIRSVKETRCRYVYIEQIEISRLAARSDCMEVGVRFLMRIPLRDCVRVCIM